MIARTADAYASRYTREAADVSRSCHARAFMRVAEAHMFAHTHEPPRVRDRHHAHTGRTWSPYPSTRHPV